MTKYQLRSEGTAWSDVGGEVVILDLQSSLYFSVKGAGTAIVAKLAEGATIDDLVAELTSRYDVEPDVARADVEEFLYSLRARELLSDLGD